MILKSSTIFSFFPLYSYLHFFSKVDFFSIVITIIKGSVHEKSIIKGHVTYYIQKENKEQVWTWKLRFHARTVNTAPLLGWWVDIRLNGKVIKKSLWLDLVARTVQWTVPARNLKLNVSGSSFCNRYCSVKGMRNVHFRLRNAEWSIIERPPHEPRYLYCLYPKIVLSCPSPRRPAFGFFFRCVNISITYPFPSHPLSFPPGDLARSRKIWRFHLQHGLHYFVWTCYSWGLEQNHQAFYFITKIYIFPDDIPS